MRSAKAASHVHTGIFMNYRVSAYWYIRFVLFNAHTIPPCASLDSKWRYCPIAELGRSIRQVQLLHVLLGCGLDHDGGHE